MMYSKFVLHLPWVESLLPANRQEFEEELSEILQKFNLTEEMFLRILPWIERLEPSLITESDLSKEGVDEIIDFLEDWKLIAEFNTPPNFVIRKRGVE